jgi:hypothetical protein
MLQVAWIFLVASLPEILSIVCASLEQFDIRVRVLELKLLKEVILEKYMGMDCTKRMYPLQAGYLSLVLMDLFLVVLLSRRNIVFAAE